MGRGEAGVNRSFVFVPAFVSGGGGVLLFGFRWGDFEASSMSKLKTERNL